MPTELFEYTGSRKTWKVPPNTTVIDVIVDGANSGSRRGGRVTGKMKVKPGDLLYLTVGRRGAPASGKSGGESVFGGGGQGGDGSGAQRPGGNGGGGASWINYGSADGPVKCVAGGAGGASGDGGNGGRGGGSIPEGEGERGERGFPAPNGSNPGNASTGNATGGTQNQSGKGGTSSTAKAYAGGDGNGRLNRGGKGGQFTNGPDGVYGGGGGGGGYYPGGGGQAGKHGTTKGGGGGGGSNFTGGLYSVENLRGSSNTENGANGSIRITWDPAGGDENPTAPNDIKIDGKPAQSGLATRSTGSVVVSGDPNDPDKKENVRLLVRYSKNSTFSGAALSEVGTYDQQTDRDKVTLRGLEPGTRYYLRIHSQQQSPKKISDNFTSTNFWTNRPPLAPTLQAPLENSSIPDTVNITFEWRHNDPDGNGDDQQGFELQTRSAAFPNNPAGEWRVVERPGDGASQWTINAFAGGGPFRPDTNYEWRVRTRDSQGKWGVFSPTKSFYIEGTAISPRPLSPTRGEAARVDRELVYRWNYSTAKQAEKQIKVDLRYRVTATRNGPHLNLGPDESWIFVPDVAGSEKEWTASEVVPAGFRVEWQVRAGTEDVLIGDWSDAAHYWTVEQPGQLVGTEPIDSGLEHAGLGEGTNRVFIYDRGAAKMRGEIKGANLVRWTRTRDDISACLIQVNQFDDETRNLIRKARTWRHEIVVFRINSEGRTERVWEGPITRKASSRYSVEIEAKDVLAYPYRRIMRQGYSDAYQEINGTQVGQKTVIQRATQILLNAFAYDDPNLIGYLTPMPNAGDSESSGSRADYSRMVWEEIDDMAAVKGLDYTAAGRRIILNDTHRPLGRLPEMTDEDFSEPPVITEYGMSAAFYFGVTDGSGSWGAAYPKGKSAGDVSEEGWIEQLASAYGEDDEVGASQGLTSKQLQARRDGFKRQAELNISGRWPPPVVVRVPDNSRLSPSLQVSINQLVPGVWIPLRADNGHQSIAQWQKLDSMQVEQDSAGERVTVVMSPAPNGGQDPDADAAALEV